MNDDTNRPSAADHIGEAAGGISGVVAGAAIGVTAGPLGVLLGGIAGAIGGWWTGRALAEAAEDITEADEAYYREDFEHVEHGTTPYGTAKRAYFLGHIAASNPVNVGIPFSGAEPELRRGWCGASMACEWENVRGFAAVGYERGQDRRRTRPESNRRQVSS